MPASTNNATVTSVITKAHRSVAAMEPWSNYVMSNKKTDPQKGTILLPPKKMQHGEKVNIKF